MRATWERSSRLPEGSVTTVASASGAALAQESSNASFTPRRIGRCLLGVRTITRKRMCAGGVGGSGMRSPVRPARATYEGVEFAELAGRPLLSEHEAGPVVRGGRSALRRRAGRLRARAGGRTRSGEGDRTASAGRAAGAGHGGGHLAQ